MTRVPQDPLRPGRTRRQWPLIDPIQGYNISKNCDDASPRFFVRLDSIWGFCVFGANWEGPVGSPTAWKNERPRPVAVLIPGYNISKIYDDASLSFFRRIFWKSLFRHFPDTLDVGFGGSYPRLYGLPGPNGDTKLLIWPLPLIYVKTAMTQVLDFVLRPNCTFACWFLL